MKDAISISFGDEVHKNRQYGSINESIHSKAPKRSSVTIAMMGHQPCHQLEVSRRSSTNSHVTTESQLNKRTLFYDEMKSMIKLAIPVTITYILEMLPGIITIILVGRVEVSGSESEEAISSQKLQIDAAALAVMFMNVVALSPGFGTLNWIHSLYMEFMYSISDASRASLSGLLTAMDTLCSQGMSSMYTRNEN